MNRKYDRGSLFFGISEERIAKLRAVTVGGKPLFTELGEFNYAVDEAEDEDGWDPPTHGRGKRAAA